MRGLDQVAHWSHKMKLDVGSVIGLEYPQCETHFSAEIELAYKPEAAKATCSVAGLEPID